MLSDFRFALRTLAKAPGFTTVAILTLALAIGVNSAVFALMNGVLFRPVVPLHPEEVVNLFVAKKSANRNYRQFSYDEYRLLREGRETFAGVAALQFSLAGIGRHDGIRRSIAFLTSENFFSMLGAKPAIGRFYTAEECRPNANQFVVVTSYSFWQSAGGRPQFVGSSLVINGHPYTVIGVAPSGFSGVNAVLAPDIWVPLGVYSQFSAAFSDAGTPDLASPHNYTLNLMARLAQGVALNSLPPRLPAMAQRLNALNPEPAAAGKPGEKTEWELQFQPPSRFSISTEPSTDPSNSYTLVAMLCMSGCVLVIATINLANMLLARGTARAKEIALRLALGATRWRIVRQLLAEGLLLSLAGGAVGLILSVWANDLLVQSIAPLFGSMNMSIVLHLRPDATVLAATLGFCCVATILFSLGPALSASRPNLVVDLKQQGGGAAHGRLTRFFAPRNCLVMAQMALSAMLLFAAALFLRGAIKASTLDLGFKPQGSLVAELDFTLARTRPEAVRQKLFHTIDRLREQPGVRAVAAATLMPYANVTNTMRIMRADQAVAPQGGAQGEDGLYTSVTSGYFDTIGVRLLRGRDFSSNETRDPGAPGVAIIDETMAKKLFPDGDALGQRIRYTQPPAGAPAEMEVIGICAAHRHDALDRSSGRARIFVPYATASSGNVNLHLRLATDDPVATAAAVVPFQKTLRRIDPDLPVIQLAPFADRIERNVGLWAVRLGAVLFGVFGGIALLLAVVGVYGVKAYVVSRRTREIGIRMALGAHPRDVLALILRQGVLQIVVALVMGAVLSLGVGRILSTMLYEVSPTDGPALSVALGLLSVAALLATFVPARRAALVEPTEALRAE